MSPQTRHLTRALLIFANKNLRGSSTTAPRPRRIRAEPAPAHLALPPPPSACDAVDTVKKYFVVLEVLGSISISRRSRFLCRCRLMFARYHNPDRRVRLTYRNSVDRRPVKNPCQRSPGYSDTRTAARARRTNTYRDRSARAKIPKASPEIHDNIFRSDALKVGVGIGQFSAGYGAARTLSSLRWFRVGRRLLKITRDHWLSML
ncbi:hypothetical protein EVAR_101915_1 [Eumeta japonica]|uniref:Uncharacterized protein n=1 Tax=Eumeta variegata TaxID=151549 RepID=A0A4C1TSG6_EUMVA|nr:hypothetical protein EVAR_101915_1 [Eumeta japonica]